LTKPDRIDTNDRFVDVKKALAGEKDPLGHGYFVVKQPSQQALEQNITHWQARADEDRFFAQDQWASYLSSYQHRFGTRNLQTALSEKLAALSSQSLPEIQVQLTQRLQEVETDLLAIPKPLHRDAVSNVTNAVHTFTDKVRKELKRKGSDNEWKSKWDGLLTGLRKDLESFKPLLLTNGSKDGPSFCWPETVDLCSDDDYGLPVGLNAPATPNKRKRDQTRASETPQERDEARLEHRSPQPLKKPRVDANPNALRFDLDKTSDDIYKLSSAKIPGHTDPKAVEELMRQGLQLNYWRLIGDTFLRKLGAQLLERIVRILEESLAKWRTTEFFRLSLNVVQDAVSEYLNEQLTVILPNIISDHANGPFLHEDPFFPKYRQDAEEAFKKARFNRRKDLYFTMLEQQTHKAVSQNDRESQAKKDPIKTIIENDPYREVLSVIAQVRAYYVVASYRFRMGIAMRVESQLFKGLRDTLWTKLNDGLGLGDEEGKNDS
jgi:hypothetical protein